MKKWLWCIGMLPILLNAQHFRKALTGNEVPVQSQKIERCSTPVPPKEWDEWFNKEVEKYKEYASNPANKVQNNFKIPVVVHVIYSPGNSVGVGDNISQAQVIDQINILNADFAGTGLNSGNVPSAFASLKSNCGIEFCLATKNPTGGVMPEPGIDRVLATSIPGISSVPGTGFTSSTIDNIIKPNTIWDPTKYCNMWVLKLQNGLLGYATFPAGTTLSGIPGSLGSAQTDGVVMGYQFFGSIGAAAGSAPYHKGRTTTHEVGHWLGLRHIWGDATCGNDFCNDTPVQNTSTGGCPSFPSSAGCSGSPNPPGKMFMNFMDYTDDLCMYMFTHDQKWRMHTAMQTGTYRKNLSVSSQSLCTFTTAAPTASFTVPSTVCAGGTVYPNNFSLGYPSPNYSWSVNPGTGVSISSNTLSMPIITFNNPGTYSITVVATNSLGNNSQTKTINVINCSGPPTSTVCADTLSNFSTSATLTVFRGAADNTVPGCSPNAGYVCGSNCYGDLEKAEYYALGTYSHIPNAQINAVIGLFYKWNNLGTSGNNSSPISMRIYNRTSTTFTGMPSGNAPGSQIGSVGATLGNINSATAVNSATYVGNPNISFVNPIIRPYKFTFSSPINAPTSGGFFCSLVLPTGAGDTAVVFNNTPTAGQNTAYEKWSDNTWYEIGTAWGGGHNYNIALLPVMNCTTTAMKNYTQLSDEIMVYPNPSQGHFNLITTFEKEKNIHVKVYNTLGQLIHHTEYKNVKNNAITIDLSKESQGFYNLVITDGKEKHQIKLLNNK
ncbi:MAG: M43 family zinc metalloprotease [Bacteroidia bacterium]|nr:M43 family zinc metalloprotease [Bacteroidia bacterium]